MFRDYGDTIMEILFEKGKIQNFRSMAQIENTIYFLSNYGNELWLFDIKNRILRKGWKLSDQRGDCVLYRKVVRCNDMLVLVPDSADDLYIFNKRAEIIRKISVPDVSIPYKQQCKFSNAFCVDKRIFLLPFCYPAILVVNIETWQVTIHMITNAEGRAVGDELFSGSYILHNNKCYIPSAQSNEVLEMDANTYVVRKYSLGNDPAWYGSISFDGKYFWLTGAKNTITRWDIAHDIVVEYAYPENFVNKKNSYPFLDTIRWMNKIILIPKKSNMFIIIDIETEDIESIQRKQEEYYSIIYTENSHCMIILDSLQAELYIMEKNKREVIQKKLDLDLSIYVQNVISDGFETKTGQNYCKNSCGDKIYSMCSMKNS